MENVVFWTIWTVILLVKHGTALTVNQELSIAEGLPTYSEVGKLRDSPPYSQLFDNSKNPVSADLDINLVTGVIKTKIILDREVRSLYTFNVISGSQNNIAVTVKVEDVNDHSPKFPKDVIKLYISENAPLGANNQLGSAIDPDIGNKTTQRYEIVEGNRNNTFSLDSKRAGDILLLDLVVNGQLDYDDPSLRTFNLLIKAFDGGNPPRFGSMRVIVHLSDANDNPPQFVVSRYSAKVMENATVGASIIQVLATDVDSGLFGHVEYSIDRDRSDRTDMFTINKNSGIIYLNRQLDYETKRSYELIVVAKDSPNATEPLETTAIVSIEVGNINEYPPSIDLLFLTEITDDSSPKLSEKASPGDYVARISVSDPDVPLFFANINVTLNGGDGHFGLTTQNNVVYLMIVSNPLDRENRPAYHLTIVATDSGVPPLTSTKSFNLLVSDTNDNAPVFTSSEYKAEVAEVSPVGTPVIKVTANDKDFGNNSVVTYSIHGGHHSTWFAIDPATGLIKTAARLDCETVSQPRITVRATDHGTPPLWGNAVVVISILDVNDNQPVFDKSNYGASVKESTQPGSCVLQVSATDPDCGLNARVTYAVSSNSGFQQPLEFVMQNETGNICINSPLDYETKSVYEFQVVARDSDGLYTTAMVKISIEDENDNRPTFYPESYAVNLLENTRDGADVALVSAVDADAGQFGAVSYAIISGNSGNVFKIGAKSGLIQLNSNIPFGQTVYQLKVTATDGGGLDAVKPADVVFSVISSSQQLPVFGSLLYRYSIQEDAGINTPVGNPITATIQGGQYIVYSIVSGDPQKMFAIRSTSGQVIISKILDHDTVPSLLLGIQAKSGNPPKFGTAQVNITITDVNDNIPQFTVSNIEIPVKETTNLATVIYQVQASDKDSKANGQIRYSLVLNPGNMFAIDAISGEVSTMGRLNFEQVKRYTVRVKAIDLNPTNPLSSTMTLVVTVQDSNDNKPIFKKTEYSTEVRESIGIGKKFLQVSADDSDSGNNARITYSLTPSPDTKWFGVYPDDGWLYIQQSLLSSSKEKFSLTVQAADNGVPRLTSFTAVNIKVLDDNNHYPTFQEKEYSFYVDENRPAMSPVGSVSAVDLDKGLNAMVYYAIVTKTNYFLIDKSSGLISTLKELDRESVDVSLLRVAASDRGTPAHSSVVEVRINIRDVNDNTPVFQGSGKYYGKVKENRPKGSPVIKLSATDKDAGVNGEITYKVIGGPNNLFVIHSKTGLISTKEVLDFEVRGEYTLTVEARDNGNPSRSSTATVDINITDINENGPLFPSTTIHFSVEEGIAAGTTIGSVRIHGADSQVSYFIVAGNLLGAFGINYTTGTMYTVREVDYELSSGYSLKVQAVDNNILRQRTSFLTVNITILDINDNPPIFEAEPIVLTLPENVDIGYSVYQYRATDKDKSVNGTVVYSIDSQVPANGYFKIDANSGVLSTTKFIDYEIIKEILIVVTASDKGPLSVRQKTSTTLRILVEDLNDNRPQLVRRPRVDIMEDEPVGFPIVHILAEDKDSGKNGRVTYNIMSGNTDGHFKLEYETGLLLIAKSLDYEFKKLYTLRIRAIDQGSPATYDEQVIKVHVVDVNDHPPRFLSPFYTANITENAAIGSYIVTIKASDRDTGRNAKLFYFIPDNIGNNLFSVDSATGIVTTAGSLDREFKDSFMITAYVKDNANPALFDTTAILIHIEDYNDNIPTFEKSVYYLSVPENSRFSDIHTVGAMDKDIGINGQIQYFIISGNQDNKFSLNRLTGKLTCSALDRESTSSYDLTIRAQDGGNPSKSSVCRIVVSVIDLNDNDPVFTASKYTKNLREDSAVGTTVVTVQTTDKDVGENSAISYSLGNNTNGMFTIDGVTGVITTVSQFDREKKSSFSFQVSAMDGGQYNPRTTSATVDVSISDVNDNAPVFKKIPYKKDILQSFPDGGLVLRVEADDADAGSNGQVVYSFEKSNTYFKIDSSTGEIKTSRALDTSARKVHQMIVIAKDLGIPSQLMSKGVVEIRVGTQSGGLAIQFDSASYTAKIKEGSAATTFIKQVQASYVGGSGATAITYSLASADSSPFSVDSSTGLITVRSRNALDYERNNRLQETVIAQGGGVFAYTMLVVNLIDKNDNPPKFTQDNYVSSVWEGARRNTYVTQVTAMDPDDGSNAEIEYQIIQGDDDHAFTIDPPYSGIVKTNLVLDREIRNSYKLLIEAVDKGYPPRSATCTLRIIVVDTNDNRPFFPKPRPLNVKEGTAIGTLLTTVTANDVDLSPPLTYNFTPEGNPDSTFTIDKLSGKIMLGKRLDYERRHQYTLRIEATDTVHLVTTDLIINIIDENDNAPVFSQNSYMITLPENTANGVAVMTVNATDADAGMNSRLIYSMVLIPVDGFTIDKDTGTIYTNKTVEYNPQLTNFQFVVIVRDQGNPSLSAVTAVSIKIYDVNDEKPVFSKALYQRNVDENLQKGQSILTVYAIDTDKSRLNSKVDYSIISGNDDGKFQIVGNTGEIILVSLLDRETVDLYVMEIVGTDRGTPVQSSSTMVRIYVDDVNDWPPQFLQQEYSADVNESLPIGNLIVTVSSTDKDIGKNKEVTYAIMSGDKDGKFSINKQSGLIKLSQKLNHEEKKTHRLVIQATDCALCPIEQRLSSYCSVLVNVRDVNDHKPSFPVMTYIESVDENKPVGTRVFTAIANDRDSGIYGQLTYKIENLQPGLFQINPATGVVTTKKVFDYEDSAGNHFFFKIIATDNGGNNVAISTQVNVGSVDEYKPSFAKASYKFKVRGDAKVGHVIGIVSANDKDGGDDGRIMYIFKDPEEYFGINYTTGAVYVAKALNQADNQRQKRSISHIRHRRSVPQESVSLLIMASSGKESSLSDVAMVETTINRTCSGCAISGAVTEPWRLSGTALVLVIVFPILAIIVIVVVVLLCLCKHRVKRGESPTSNLYANHNGAFDPVPIQGVRHMTPVIKARGERSELVTPSYNDLHDFSGTPNLASEISDQSHSASSGRGSAEENDEDEEICHINSTLNGSNSLTRKSMPDSGIQQDEDNISEHSVRNHQEYLARLGIDVGKIGSDSNKPTASVESIHQFSEEGGGESDGLDLGNIIYGKLAECDPDENLSNISSSQELGFDEVEPSTAGSLSSVINSEEEFSGSYNWDYLLDWGPQYQPLAHVFTEIARLKDESIQPKKQPTQIVPQRPYPTSFNPVKMKNLPPPIITNAPPLAKPLSSSSSQQNSPSYSPSSVHSNGAPPRTIINMNGSHVLPRSPITNDYQSSVYTPSFTPSLSPLATGSPLVSPLNGSQGSISHGSSVTSGQNTPRGYGRRVINAYPAPKISTSGSEQELHI